MKDLLHLSAKHDRVIMGLPLGPLFAITFIISLEEALLAIIKKHVYVETQNTHWKQYVNGTPANIDPSKIKYALEELNYIRNYITLCSAHR